MGPYAFCTKRESTRRPPTEHRTLVRANPDDARLLYNVACCESLAGRTDDAIEHLRRAIEVDEQMRELATGDSDFDPIRTEPGFRALVG